MRVTQQMMAASTLGNLNNLRARQASLSEQISSGDRITRVSEDPTAGAEVMRIQNRGQAVKQWKVNLGDAKSWVYATESKLGDMTNILNQAKELAMQAFNGSASDETRKGLAAGAEQILEDLKAAMNEREPVGALFGGFVTDADPFSVDAAGVVTYNGDANALQRDVGPGITLTSNISGDRLAGNLPGGWTNQDNMLSTAWGLAQALKAGKTEYTDPGPPPVVKYTADQIMSNLDNARQNVIALRSEMGARQIRIEAMETRITDTEVKLESALEEAQGVDAAKALLELSNAETTYRAALQVGGRVLPQSLADFLR